MQMQRKVNIEDVALDKVGMFERTSSLHPGSAGVQKNGLAEAGIQNPRSIQIPVMISLDHWQDGIVGNDDLPLGILQRRIMTTTC
ncbi:hypothetical protein ACEPAF_8202 [Sanghuangporus sanghuang]